MNQENIAKKIKELRKEHNLTQKEFADIFGVTYQAVSKWETAKNIPDIAILKEICKKYDLDVNEFLEIKKNNKKHPLPYILIIIFIFLTILLITAIANRDDFTFQKLTTDCEEFDLLGSVAYNNDKTAIHISDIEYCKDEEITYEEITCVLYEESKGNKIKVEDCNIKNNKNINLNDYLNEVNIMIDDYKTTCNSFLDSKMYLEISAVKDEKTTTYKVPLTLDGTCTK